ncbi:xanthine phosphoribosyltransferase [Ruminococcaceae bacterium R-25]|nr:xanthine phosphoribosyltransferase [Ruminococcaceae bacterium R-25]SUQ11948.1 xanthine phosphoribosyltransferase [Oscillospiraceae bacterium]
MVHIRTLEQRILTEGQILPGEVLKVGSFLNQQIDTKLLKEMGDEVARLFSQSNVTKVLTIESSGIALAYAVAVSLGVPMVFAKKHKSSNLAGNILTSKVFSYTHQQTYDIMVSGDYIKSDDVILIVDDFLAMGNALNGLIDITGQAGAKLAGCAIAIEKGFQGGGDALRAKGVRVESLAIIDKMTDDSLEFRPQ